MQNLTRYRGEEGHRLDSVSQGRDVSELLDPGEHPGRREGAQHPQGPGDEARVEDEGQAEVRRQPVLRDPRHVGGPLETVLQAGFHHVPAHQALESTTITL